MQKRDFQKYVKIYQPIMEAMHAMLGEYSEFILHDLSMPEASVTAVCGNVTGRQIGAPTTNLVMETISKYGDDAQDVLCYPSVAKDGRQLKSMTTFIREKGKIVGCLCCNIDLTEYIMAQKLLCGFCKTRSPVEEEPKKEVFAQEISEVVEDIIRFELDNLSKPIPHMTRTDKLALVETLEAKGVFDVKGSAETVAQHIGVSVFTVYNYIKEVRSSNKAV